MQHRLAVKINCSGSPSLWMFQLSVANVFPGLLSPGSKLLTSCWYSALSGLCRLWNAHNTNNNVGWGPDPRRRKVPGSLHGFGVAPVVPGLIAITPSGWCCAETGGYAAHWGR